MDRPSPDHSALRSLLVSAVAAAMLVAAWAQEPAVEVPRGSGAPAAVVGPAAAPAVPSPASAPGRATSGGRPSRDTASGAPAARPAAVVARGDGVLTRVPGTSARRGSGPLHRYTVAVEGGLGVDVRQFARAVEQVLGDDRSWGSGGRRSFRRVAEGPVSFRVVLASPVTTDRLCAPLRTAGRYSCASGRTAVVNSLRWLRGAQAYAGQLEAYRAYLVNHEVGHTLGRGHVGCPGPGLPAPVMMQQTIGVGACRPSPWPYP